MEIDPNKVQIIMFGVAMFILILLIIKDIRE